MLARPADTVVLGLGFPTLVPGNGEAEVAKPHAHKSDPADPTSLQGVFFRIDGATPGM